MNDKAKKSFSLLGLVLLTLVIGLPSFAEAGRRGHHWHKHGHHHGYRHHHHHRGYGGYVNQPYGYYNRQYFQPYVQPGVGYNYYPAPVYANPPIYGPNVMFDIFTGNGHFMFQY